MGGFAAMSGILDQGSMEQAIMEKFPGKIGTANVQAARAAFEAIQSQMAQFS
jgi:pyruvate ferredoxin oxidoreductase gamma subunit